MTDAKILGMAALICALLVGVRWLTGQDLPAIVAVGAFPLGTMLIFFGLRYFYRRKS